MHRNTQSPACSLNQTVIVSNNYTLGNGRVTQKSCALPHCRPLAWLRASCWVPRTPEAEATISPACQPSERLQWPCGLQCLVGSSRKALCWLQSSSGPAVTDTVHCGWGVGRQVGGKKQILSCTRCTGEAHFCPSKHGLFPQVGKKMALPHQLRSTQSMK